MYYNQYCNVRIYRLLWEQRGQAWIEEVRKDIPEEATSKLRPEKGVSAFWSRKERKGAEAGKCTKRPGRRKSLARSGVTGGSQWLEGRAQARWSTMGEEAGKDAGPAHTLPARQRRLTLIQKAVRNH